MHHPLCRYVAEREQFRKEAEKERERVEKFLEMVGV